MIYWHTMYRLNQPAARFRFERKHGTHTFNLKDGRRVSAISQPSWNGFEVALQQLDNPGDYVVSPELITVSPAPTSLAGIENIIAGRTARALEISQQMPQTTILLGSVAILSRSVKPRNVMHFVRDGQIVGTTPKMPYLDTEARFFYQAYNAAEQRKPDSQTLGMICSDIQFHAKQGRVQLGLPDRNLGAEYVDPISPQVNTVLIGAHWIAPYDLSLGGDLETERFIDPLKISVRDLMTAHPNLTDIVMCDQLAPGTSFSGPVNFHAQRQ